MFEEQTFHCKRAKAGIIPNQISLWMGHSDLKTTMQYYVSISPDFEPELTQFLTQKTSPFPLFPHKNTPLKTSFLSKNRIFKSV